MRWLNRKKIEKQLPPGIEVEKELKAIVCGFFAAVIYSMSFIYKYIDARNSLFVYRYGKEKTIMEGAVMPPIEELLENTMDGFLVFLMVMCLLILVHYMSYYRDSKSIYLMRRLSDKWELYRRCIVVPVVAIFIAIITATACLVLYFRIYLYFTPVQCLVF